jgi:hypothetical protein
MGNFFFKRWWTFLFWVFCMNLGGAGAEARITEETGNMVDDKMM